MFDYKPKTKEQELNDDIKELESFVNYPFAKDKWASKDQSND